MTTRRPSLAAALMLSLLAGAPAHAQPPSQNAGQSVLRIYDARDFAAILPASESGSYLYSVPVLSDVPLLTRFYARRNSLSSPDAQPNSQPDSRPAAPSSPTDLVVSHLCDQLGLQKQELVSGVYLVTGDNGQQDQFVSLMNNLRTLYQGVYEVEIFSYTVAAPQCPAVGSPADAQSAALRTRQVLARRVESRIALTEELTYVRDWVPIVGTDSVGYDPDPATVTRGLRLSVTAGASDSPNDGVIPVRVRGEWIDAHIDHQSSPLAPTGGGNLEIGLPVTTIRSIESDLRVKPGQPTVLAAFPSSKAGESIVLGGAVRELR